MENIDEFITLMSQASDRQLDKSIIDRLNKLKGKPIQEIKPEFLSCIDDCQMYSLASGFAIMAMKTTYEVVMDGKQEDYGCRIVNTKI
jgi:hypothetical protein